MDQCAVYQIQVRGEVDDKWSSRLAGMSITVDHSNEHEVRTMLKGFLRDQAALSGVLNTLYELHLPVLSVERLSNGRSE